ncbi:MAG: alpha/beta hydrolase fold domain-containing protein [Rhodobacteraceae bacterium]|nr:alpha/beta hydrolase fold domain-containing protein [Paracoccaceae bacterium]
MVTDRDYENGTFIPGAEAYAPRWAEAARAWREVEHDVGRARLNQPYGNGAREQFDLFYPAGRPKGLFVFFHGGYWMAFDRSGWSHFARGATEAGWAVAMPSYTLAPEARISRMTAQIGAAVSAAADQVPGPIVLAGHSAGGHLVARMASTTGPLGAGVAGRLQRVMPISPLSDLRPFLGLTINETLGLDAAEAEAESALLQEQGPAPVTVWVGAEERPVFLDQARWLAEAWPRAELKVAPGRHHFDVIDELEQADSPLMRALLAA